MVTLIRADEVGKQMWDMLEQVVEEEYEGEPESVKEEAKFNILQALSMEYFG